jgi:quercetin dioxygenase-like cupin family protein
MPTRGPAGSGCAASRAVTSSCSNTVSVRITPACSNSASTETSEAPSSARVGRITSVPGPMCARTSSGRPATGSALGMVRNDTGMGDYAIVNLLEIDDDVQGRVEGLEGRFGRKALGARDIGVSHWRYAPNLRSPGAHSHREQEEAYVVVAGSGRVRLDDEIRDVRQWDVVRVAPDVVRAFEAGPDGLELIAVGGPKPEGGDGVRSDAPWPDEG